MGSRVYSAESVTMGEVNCTGEQSRPESSCREGVELVCKAELEPSGRPNAMGTPGRGICKGKGMCQEMKRQNQQEVAAEV